MIAPLKDVDLSVYLAFIKPYEPGQPAGTKGWSLYRINYAEPEGTPKEVILRNAQIVKSLAGLLFENVYSYDANRNYSNVIATQKMPSTHEKIQK